MGAGVQRPSEMQADDRPGRIEHVGLRFVGELIPDWQTRPLGRTLVREEQGIIVGTLDQLDFRGKQFRRQIAWRQFPRIGESQQFCERRETFNQRQGLFRFGKLVRQVRFRGRRRKSRGGH
jgi:hypothetical protein